MRSNRWLVFGGIATVVLVLGGAFLAWRLSGLPSLNRETQHQTYDHAVTRIVFDHLDSSDVKITGQAGATGVNVERRLRWSGDSPDIQEAWSGDTLTISASCENSALAECSVDYTVTVPANVVVEADLSSGDFTLVDLAGPTRVSTQSGDVRVRGFTGDSLDTRSTSGDLILDDLSAKALKAEATSGDIQATFQAAPTTVDARATSGDVTVVVPRSAMTYRVHLTATSGDLNSDITNTDGGTGSISAETTSGDVKVQLA